jgi:hypothetical protein
MVHVMCLDQKIGQQHGQFQSTSAFIFVFGGQSVPHTQIIHDERGLCDQRVAVFQDWRGKGRFGMVGGIKEVA